MNKLQYKFSGKTTTCYLDADFAYLEKLVDKDHTVLITDEHIFAGQQKKFGGWNTIVISAGEQFKVQATVDSIIDQLIAFGADRKTCLIGVGGGVVGLTRTAVAPSVEGNDPAAALHDGR